jgi:RNA-splicing ligase RtcB
VIRPAVHGAGRLFGREEAKRRFTKAQMDEWLQQRGVTLVGADLDESPMAYRRTLQLLPGLRQVRLSVPARRQYGREAHRPAPSS